MLELLDLMLEDRQGRRSDKFWKNGNHRTGVTRETRPSLLEEQKNLHEEDGPLLISWLEGKLKLGEMFNSTADESAYMIEGKSLVVLLVNCRIVYNKTLEFRNLVDT